MLASFTDMITRENEKKDEIYDHKLITYMNYLSEYILICEEEGDYKNLNKCKNKIEEIKSHEEKRFLKLFNRFQPQEGQS